jgi:hypothetical protein
MVLQVIDHGLLLGQGRVDMLRVDPHLASVTPPDLSLERFERTAESPQKGGLALAIIANNTNPPAMLHFDLNIACHFEGRITDREPVGAKGRSLAGGKLRKTTSYARFVPRNVDHMQPLKLFRLAPRLAGRIGVGAVFVDEDLELFPFGRGCHVDPLVMFAPLRQVFQIDVDITGKHRQLPAAQLERMGAAALQEGPVVGNDQTATAKILEKVLQQHLGPQIEKVGRFIQNQHIRIMQQQRGQFHPGLPPT